ncbi:unnamed protein product [Lepeophtheirus salmonis]|uniref:(salmon louse) hypothetical protein n=1 Tax=Lepeophtheirus salmonis TaxID=72036 RepID=A0A817FC42_LEPSM|nr:unnamed protein product [Lepeophtheirus salmonis]
MITNAAKSGDLSKGDIDEDISDYFAACKTCHAQTSSPSSQYVPFTPADAWERIQVYYAKVNSKNVLVLMESGSKWIEAATMSNSTQSLQIAQEKLDKSACQEGMRNVPYESHILGVIKSLVGEKSRQD